MPAKEMIVIEKKVDGGERLLEIGNVHSADCGAPPSLDAAGKYVGYFENGFCEQWVFVGDRKSCEAVVCGGDAGWSKQYKVSIQRPCPVGLVLQEAEQIWLINCFASMCNRPYSEVYAAYKL
jgi:hypothetical protein